MIIIIVGLLALLLLGFIVLWGLGVREVTDLQVPSYPRKDLKKFKKILIVHPHADDEVLTSGGLTQIVSDYACHVTLLILTRGEKGTDDASLLLTLKDVRVKEARRVAKLLKIKKVIQEDLGDGEVRKNRDRAVRIVKRTIEREKPDLIICYDLAGMYGHEDHMTTSEVVTTLVQNTSLPLWYAALPSKLLSRMKLPVHMAKDKNFAKKRAIPSHRIFIGGKVINKIRGVYQYKSQFGSFKRSRPSKILPVWFQLSLSLYEYYFEVPKNKK